MKIDLTKKECYFLIRMLNNIIYLGENEHLEKCAFVDKCESDNIKKVLKKLGIVFNEKK